MPRKPSLEQVIQDLERELTDMLAPITAEVIASWNLTERKTVLAVLTSIEEDLEELKAELKAEPPPKGERRPRRARAE